MPPRKSAATKSKKAVPAASAHGSYQDMIKDAIIALKERNGSSRQAIKKYIRINNDFGSTTDAAFNNHINRALASGEDANIFDRPKGASGPVKLAKPNAAKTTEKKSETKASEPAKASKPAAKTATKKTATTKVAPAQKAAPPSKKKSATKANASRPRKAVDPKTPAAAPAVEDKPAVSIGKTRTGRVVKSKAPQPTAAVSSGRKAPKTRVPAAKKAAPKKSTPKKAAVEAAA